MKIRENQLNQHPGHIGVIRTIEQTGKNNEFGRENS
jgi:hypothetical protein